MFAEGGPVGSSLLLGLKKVRAKAHVPFPEDRRVIETTDAEADVREGETRVVRLAEEVQRASASAQASRKQRVRGSVASRSQFPAETSKEQDVLKSSLYGPDEVRRKHAEKLGGQFEPATQAHCKFVNQMHADTVAKCSEKCYHEMTKALSMMMSIC